MAFKCTFQSLSFFCLHYIVFAKVASHSPISSLIPQFTSHWPICLSFSNFTSFANLPLISQFASHSPICLSFPNLPLIHQFASQFAKRSYLPIISHSFSKPSPTFTKRGRKNIFNTPKYLPWMRKGICRALYCPYPVPVFLFF